MLVMQQPTHLLPTLRSHWWAPLSRKQVSGTDILAQRGRERCVYPARKQLDHGAPKMNPLYTEASWELSCQEHSRPTCT